MISRIKLKIFIYALLVIFFTDLSAQNGELNLLPMPAKMAVGEGKVILDDRFTVSLTGQYDDRLKAEATRFLGRLADRTGTFFKQYKVNSEKAGAILNVSVDRTGKVVLSEDESYVLQIDQGEIMLKAKTDIGAIRGLETLLQLVQADEKNYYFPYVNIEDGPRFVWRGLMLDVARHFMPLNVIYRNLDAMASLKLNVLHLHLSDDQGFRFESRVFPELTEYGSDGKFYTQDDIREIIAYADQRGIRVMPEIDVPGHATAILTAFPDLGSKDTTYAIERYAGIFNPTLDPTNEEVYDFLERLFAEVAEVFPDPYFHIGGDENSGNHWNANKKIQAFKKANEFDTNHELQTYFNIRLQKTLNNLGKKTIGWEEIMTPDMPETAVVHSWKGKWEGVEPKKSLYDAARKGYETILSNGYYLDLMQPASIHYSMDPAPADADLTEEERKRILGGEMCMWSELVVPETIDSRLWPRGAAIAERFWSPESINGVEDMYRRLNVVSLELEQLGLQHITTQGKILRKLANGINTEPLKILIDVVEPMKGYTRNPGGTMYASYSPFTLWVDATLPESLVAREFNARVAQYVRNSSGEKYLRDYLERWEVNHAEVEQLIRESPILAEISGLSANLSKISRVGLEAIQFLETDKVPPTGWITNSEKLLVAAEENGGRTELQVIVGMRMLVEQVEESAK